jgi:hypothetical protein
MKPHMRRRACTAAVAMTALAVAAVPTSGTALAGSATACQTRTVSIGWTMPSNIPPWVGGDRDYHGNGPTIQLRASTAIGSVLAADGHHGTLSVRIFMDARETKSDFTRASGEVTKEIYRAPAGWFVQRSLPFVNSDERWFEDHDWGQDDITPGRPDSFVAEYHVIGDREGDEAGIWTRVWVETKPMTLHLSTCLTG